MTRRRVNSWSLINKLEKLLIRTIFLGIITVIISQTLLTCNYGRQLLSQTDRLEGNTIQSFDFLAEGRSFSMPINIGNWQKKGFIALHLLNNPEKGKVKILLNGREVAQFSDEVLTIKVHNNDLVQIDTAECPSAINLKLVKVSPNLIFPRVNSQFICKGNIISLGVVKIKD